VRRVARWLQSEPLVDLVEAVRLDATVDGDGWVDPRRSWPDLRSDHQLDRVLRSNPGPWAHPASTCRLGRNGDDSALVGCVPGRFGAVPGHAGLRVVDASVLPDLVAGGLQIPVMAVAARVADDLD
jgi:choline dehydrogenase